MVLGAIWGSSFLLIKIALKDFTAAEITFARCAFGAGAVAVASLFSRQRLPRETRLWWHLFVSAFILNSVPFTLFGMAEQHTSSAVAGVANATAPLFTVLFALAALSDERPTRRRLAGLGVGLAGVAVVLGIWRGIDADTIGIVMALSAAACYGLGWVYLRRFVRSPGHSPLMLTLVQMSLATLQMGVLLAVVTRSVPLPGLGPAVAVIVLGAVGTGLAYVLQHAVIRAAGATVASTVTYLIPLFAIAAGVVFLDESLTWNVFAGAFLVLVGAMLVNSRAGGTRPGTGQAPARR